MKIIAFIILFALPMMANSLPSEKRKNGPLIQQALAPVQVSLQESSAVFYNNEDSRQFIYGTVMSEDGLILTKASELMEVEDFHVRVGSRKYRAPQILARNETWDVALVKIEAEQLLAVDLSSSSELGELEHGTWIVSNGAAERRFRRVKPGIVSANKREIPGGSPAVLGVALNEKDGGLMVGSVTEGSGAEKAGLKKGDQLVEIDGSGVEDSDGLIKYLRGKLSGDSVAIKVKRGEEHLDFTVELMARHKLYPAEMDRNDQLSGGLEQISERRTGFPMVIQHETMVTRRTVGGPVFTLDGHFVGMNIAAVNRVEAFAIPSQELAEVFESLKQ